MTIDYPALDKQIDEANAPNGIVRFWTLPRAVDLTDEELDTRIPDLYRSYRLNRKGLGEHLVEKHRRLSCAGCKGGFKAFLEKVQIPRSTAYEIMDWYQAVGKLNTVLLDAAEDEIGWGKMLSPRILKSLTQISAELEGRVPTSEELSALLKPLRSKSAGSDSEAEQNSDYGVDRDSDDEAKEDSDGGAERESDGDAKHGPNSKREKKSKKPQPPIDPDPAKWTRKGESVPDARAYCLDVIGKLSADEKKENPFLIAFANAEPSAPLRDQELRDAVRILLRDIVRNSPMKEHLATAEIFLQVAQQELDFVRENLAHPAPAPELVGQPSLGEEPMSKLSASDLSEPVTESPAKPRRRLLLDWDENGDVFQQLPNSVSIAAASSQSLVA